MRFSAAARVLPAMGFGPTTALAAAATDIAPGAARIRHRVLIVDDEPDILESLPLVLEGAMGLPVEVDVASSGEEALRKLRDGAYAMVITDERMPGLRGSEVLAWVRRARPRTARVLMSAYYESFAAAGTAPGAPGAEPAAHLFVRKPFRIEALRRDLLALLEQGGPEADGDVDGR